MSEELTHPYDGGKRRTAVWKDKNGTTHRAVGSTVLPNIRLLWTHCGKMDIPANAAWFERPEDHVDCPDCINAMKERLTP